MPAVIFISHDGEATTIDVDVGSTLMSAAVMSGLDGIEGMCGGCLSCASCHVYVEPTWADKLPAPEADELSMLEMVASERRETSRLSCQIVMSDALDGIVLHTPERQF